MSYNRYRFEMDRLFLGLKDTGWRLVRDEKYDHMFWIEGSGFPDGRSVQMYNITNAKDNAKVYHMKLHPRAGAGSHTEVTGEFKLESGTQVPLEYKSIS